MCIKPLKYNELTTSLMYIILVYTIQCTTYMYVIFVSATRIVVRLGCCIFFVHINLLVLTRPNLACMLLYIGTRCKLCTCAIFLSNNFYLRFTKYYINYEYFMTVGPGNRKVV